MKDLIEKIDLAYEQFKTDACKQAMQNNKTAGTRARKVSLEITKLLKEYRAKSIEVSK